MARICEYANLRVGTSKIANAGLGLFTSVPRKKGERLAIPMNGFLVYRKKQHLMDPQFQNVIYGCDEFFCNRDELMKFGLSLEPDPSSTSLADDDRKEQDVHLVPFPFDPLRYVNDPRKWNGQEFSEDYHDGCRPNLEIGVDELFNMDMEGLTDPRLTYAEVVEDMEVDEEFYLVYGKGITLYPSTNRTNAMIMPAS